MSDQALSSRQQRAVDYILDDESLTSDLTDDQARPLIDWATEQAARVAADPNRPESEIDNAIRAIRRSILRISSLAPDEHNAERLVGLAQTEFNQQMPSLLNMSNTSSQSE